MKNRARKSSDRKNYIDAELPKGSIEIYKDLQGELRLEVRLEKETIWLTQKQIAELFQAERSVITKHLKNIFSSKELDEGRNVQKTHIPFSDKPVKFYALDVIISIGYRVNSKRATQFRIWATKVLKNYLLQGYAINQKRLLETQERFKELQRAVHFLKEKAETPLLQEQSQELLNILNVYSQSLSLLHQYDEGKLRLYSKKKPCFVLEYKNCKSIIENLKHELKSKDEASALFGQEVGDKFNGIVGTIYQTFDKKELYNTLEEKAANILYLIIKDHPFVDGNKRIACTLFIYYLDKNDYLWKKNYERKITDTTLVALALLIAESQSREKEVMIKLITNLLKDSVA